MSAMKPIAATVTRDRHGAPLVVLEGQPFNGLEIYPAALREMASQLDALARLAASRPTGAKYGNTLHVELRTPPNEPAKAGNEAVTSTQAVMSIGQRLKEERERLNLSQTALAEAAGTTKQTQFSYETDRTPPKASYLAAVVPYGVDVAYVVTGQRPEGTPTEWNHPSWTEIFSEMLSATALKKGRK
jgi:DNA-binding XRE family transcriptional regulator